MTGNSEANVLTGGTADDIFYTAESGGADTFNGGDGNDTLNYTGSGITADLLADSNTLNSIEVINLTSGSDTFTSDNTGRTINGGGGTDNITGGSGNDIINANGTIDGGAGNDTITSGATSDTIHAGDGDDIIDSGDGDDVITDTGGSDNIDGGGDNYGVSSNGDLLDYSSSTDAITSASFNGRYDVTINTDAGDTDTITDIEQFTLTNEDDTISVDGTGIDTIERINMGGGNDTLQVTGNLPNGGGTEGAYLGSIFRDVEELDISSATITDGTFDISNIDIATMNGSTMTVTAASLSDVNAVNYNTFTDNGTSYQYDWNDGTTLIVQT